MKVLVLNADFSPHEIWPWKKAMMKWLGSECVTPVEVYNKTVRSGGGKEWPIPSILVLKEYVKTTHKSCPYGKKRVYNRDRHKCQYCNVKLHPRQLTLDHVIPKSVWKKTKQGTPNCYTNVVAACLSCNSRKANRTPEEAGMRLLSEPKALTYQQAFINDLLMNDVPKEWFVYLEPYIKIHME